jgi:hypothetical protein
VDLLVAPCLVLVALPICGAWSGILFRRYPISELIGQRGSPLPSHDISLSVNCWLSAICCMSERRAIPSSRALNLRPRNGHAMDVSWFSSIPGHRPSSSGRVATNIEADQAICVCVVQGDHAFDPAADDLDWLNGLRVSTIDIPHSPRAGDPNASNGTASRQGTRVNTSSRKREESFRQSSRPRVSSSSLGSNGGVVSHRTWRAACAAAVSAACYIKLVFLRGRQ